jgi:hypothetical protein
VRRLRRAPRVFMQFSLPDAAPNARLERASSARCSHTAPIRTRNCEPFRLGCDASRHTLPRRATLRPYRWNVRIALCELFPERLPADPRLVRLNARTFGVFRFCMNPINASMQKRRLRCRRRRSLMSKFFARRIDVGGSALHTAGQPARARAPEDRRGEEGDGRRARAARALARRDAQRALERPLY